jgi:hypothetical protein
MKTTNEEIQRLPETLSLSLNFGTSAQKLSKQIKAQGFKYDVEFIKQCDKIRVDILALTEVGVLTKKQSKKAFKRINDAIANDIAHETYGDAIEKIEKIK